MLHSNELFLCHLIEGIDGPTSCNTGFLGEDLVDILETIINNMSADQKQSYKLCKAVKIVELPNLREI